MAEISRLPAPIAEHWDWQARGACRGVDTATFFHPENERGSSRVRREQTAKAICARCPVTAECLNWALSVREPYGVWGGKSTDERAGMLRNQAAI